MSKKSLVTLWAGFCDDKIHIEPEPRVTNDRYGQLYKTRAEGRKYYQDVRRVEIREAKK